MSRHAMTAAEAAAVRPQLTLGPGESVLWHDGALLVPDSIDAQVFTADRSGLKAARIGKIAELRDKASIEMLGGVKSAALGSVHTYPTTLLDQQNMAASVVDAMSNGSAPGWVTPFPCADVNGFWDHVPHTAVQIKQAGADMKSFIVTRQMRLKSLIESVNAATTPGTVNAITW